jgi:hypothetical protein
LKETSNSCPRHNCQPDEKLEDHINCAENVTNKIKKQEMRESFYLEKFLEALQLKVETIERGANPPDFILTQAKKQIAVEVTEFHSDATGSGGHPRRLIEEEWAKLQQLIQRERKHYPDLNNISGLLFFNKLAVPSRVECPQFVEELLEFSRNCLKSLTDKGGNFSSFGTNFPLLRKYLKRLHLAIVECYITWEWNHSASSVGLNEAEMKKTVLKKLEIPRSKIVSENWLLIVSGHQLSQSMGLPDVEELNAFQEVNEALKNGPYDKVFIFQYMFDRVLFWELSSGWIELRRARFAKNGKLGKEGV